MITVLPDSPNIAAATEVLPILEQAYAEVRKLLPELPENLDIWLINNNPIDTTGVSGFAYSPSIITIDYAPDFADKQLQQQALRATIFHESYHLAQGHTNEENSASYQSALDAAVYEGAATIFERKYAEFAEPYGDYSTTDETLLAKWRDEMATFAHADFLANDGVIWQQWAFYDQTDGYGWKMYKTGTWIVDQYLAQTGKDTLDIVRTPAAELLPLIQTDRT